MNPVKATINPDGRLLIPAPMRRALDLKAGSRVVLTLDGDALRVSSVRHGVQRAQQQLRRFVPERTALADGLIAERRREAKRG